MDRRLHMVPIENESKVKGVEFCVAMFLCKKVVNGRLLPQELPAVLQDQIDRFYEFSSSSSSSSSSSESESSSDYSSRSERANDYSDYSESASSDYSDYSDYNDYSESSSSSSSESDGLGSPKPALMANAFARKGRTTTSIAEKTSSKAKKSPKEKSPKEKSPQNAGPARPSWKMPEETRRKLETEVFPRYAGEAKEMSVSTLRETFRNAGVSDETVQQV